MRHRKISNVQKCVMGQFLQLFCILSEKYMHHININIPVDRFARNATIYLLVFKLCRYWDTLLGIMWPRFETILHLNIQSVRDVDPQKFGHIDNRPHYVRLTLYAN